MSTRYDQQPLQRTVGRRRERDGRPLTADERALLARNARYRTRAPKGVFRYTSAEAMDADRQQWTVDLMIERQRAQ